MFSRPMRIISALAVLAFTAYVFVAIYLSTYGKPPDDPARGVVPRALQIVSWPIEKTIRDMIRNIGG